MQALQEKSMVDFANYRAYVSVEQTTHEVIITRQQEMLNIMFQELRATKTLLEIPRLREQLPKYDFKGMNFEKFTEIFGKIYSDISLRYSKYALPPGHTSEISASLYPKESIVDLGNQSQITDTQN